METELSTPDVILKGKWQWKSDPDPWLQFEGPHWEFYSLEQNFLIDKAYYDKEKEVDLGDYVVSLCHMRQHKKGNIRLQRPIRRITCENNEMEVRSERYFETELPKTINKIFGSLEHFLRFFSRRNSEIMDFTKQFEEFERTNNLNGLNKNILPELINCLEEELVKPIEVQLKDHSLSELQKKLKLKCKERHEDLISLLRKDFLGFEEFYGRILKSYTMNTSLYMNLNKFLRNESWTALDKLLPYAICLCKAFFSLKFSNNDQKEKELPVTENSIILYRGTALDDFALTRYQAKEDSKYFSWNSVTSTSRNKRMAEKFMYHSVDMENKKYPVLFIIEIPFANESTYMKWIDIHKYSAIPNEDEVILAPGSAFELIALSTDEERRTTIQIKLKHEVESLARGGLIMQGAFQSEMMSDTQVKIMCLEGEEFDEALKNIRGNRLIEEIEFCLCVFDKKLLEVLLLMLPTLEKVRGLKFISCKYECQHEIGSVRLQDVKDCKISEIEISEVQDLFRMLSFHRQGDNFWGSLKTVKIDFRNPKFSDHEIQSLKFPTQLTSLTLNFSWCYQITNEGVSNLASKALKDLTQLTSLALDFSGCSKITDEGVNNLATQGLKNLTQLTSLVLNLSDCSEVTDEGVNILASQALKYLTQLTSLTMNLFECEQITDEGVDSLASQALQYLIQLNSLTLNFSNCWRITNEGVNVLVSQALKGLTQLTSLILNFSKCSKITDKGMNILASQALTDLTQLTSLTLNFSDCWKITDERINDLESQALKNLTQLTYFNFNGRVVKETCQHYQIRSNHGRKNELLCLNFTRTMARSQLKSFGFGSTRFAENRNSKKPVTSSELFKEKERAANKFLVELMYPQYLETPMTSTLKILSSYEVAWMENNFDKNVMELTETFFPPGEDVDKTEYKYEFETETEDCFHDDVPYNTGYEYKFETKTEDRFYSDVYRTGYENEFGTETEDYFHYDVPYETRYEYKFETKTEDYFYSDVGLRYVSEEKSNLKSPQLEFLTQLTSLTLDRSECEQLTDLGVSNLASQALKNLTQLTSLTLNFSDCLKISDEGVNDLASKGLQHLTQLTSLTLNFSKCSRITDEGVYNLASQALRYLTKLASLTLDFSRCREITDEGVNLLASQALKYLTQLTSLNLNFSSCWKITDQGVNNLIYLTIKRFFLLTAFTLEISSWSISEFTVSSISKMLNYAGFIKTEDDCDKHTYKNELQS